MSKASTNAGTSREYASRHVMEPGPLADRKLTGTWKDYVTVTKIGIIMGNLLTVITGMFLAANGSLAGQPVLLTLIGTALIIASGTCLNNYLDRDIDQKMLRTKKRSEALKRVHPKQVLLMGIIAAILGTTILLNVNELTTLVALFGLFGYVVLYTMWWKRKHHLNTVVGSIAGAIPPVIGWVAVTGSIDPGAWILFSIMFVWQIPHFLAIAIRRHEDYRNAGIPMLPVIKGFKETKWFMLNYVAALIPVSLLVPLFIPVVKTAYIWMALLLGIVWLVLSIRGLKAQDDILWARKYFVYSLIYLTVMFVGMMLFTL